MDYTQDTAPPTIASQSTVDDFVAELTGTQRNRTINFGQIRMLRGHVDVYDGKMKTKDLREQRDVTIQRIRVILKEEEGFAKVSILNFVDRCYISS